MCPHCGKEFNLTVLDLTRLALGEPNDNGELSLDKRCPHCKQLCYVTLTKEKN